MRIIEKIKSFAFKTLLHLKEKKYAGRLKYLFFDYNSRDLLVFFSGFTGEIPKYNYVKSTLNMRSYDKLFILDDFGYKGSYYWFENGRDIPTKLVEGLLSSIIGNQRYQNIYMLGSSKGGTCAIYYGLQFNATAVFSGANQYYINKYLNVPERQKVLDAMVGGGNF